MAEILLISEAFVKGVTDISDNVAGKYLLPSIREAQDIGLQSIIGQDLLTKLKDLVASGEIKVESNAHYRDLIEKCRYYLSYKAVSELTFKVSYKVANIGVAKLSDEKAQVVSLDEVEKIRNLYQAKADSEAYMLQNYLLENRTKYPELTQKTAYRIHSNIVSHADCGIFLGGARGKRRY